MKKINSLSVLLLTATFIFAGCQKSAEPVNLNDVQEPAPEEAQTTPQAQVEELTALLNQQETDGEVDYLKVIELARAYEALDQKNKAIALYEKYLNEGHKEIAMISNLGLLYKETAQYPKAIEQYQRLVDEFDETNYWNDMARVYAQMKDLDNAQKAYDAWKEATGATDELTEQILEGLK